MSDSTRTFGRVICEFEYRPNRLQTLVLFLLACGGEVMFCYLAVKIDQPVNVRGFQITPQQARLLMTALALLAPTGVLALGGLMVSSLFQQRRLVLTDESVILPKPSWHGLSSAEIELPFEAIKATAICPFIGSTRLLRLDREIGAISIPSNMFPNRRDFEELVVLLSDARNAAAERTSADKPE
ncbi:MAG: hypothetical protein FJ302_02835 [Planctomycetes bacterium]|nr:hypothetical protein [Planctomycetota bacterium]